MSTPTAPSSELSLLPVPAREQPRRSAAALVLALLLALGALLAAGPASAEPTAQQVAAQQAEAARLAALAAAQSGQSAQAQAQLEILSGLASQALEARDVAAAQAALARQRADEARARADVARDKAARAFARQLEAEQLLAEINAEVLRTRNELSRYAAAAYRNGGSLGSLEGASSLLDAGDVADFSRRIAMLRWAGQQQGHSLDKLETAEDAQRAATRIARQAAAEAADQRAIAEREEATAVAEEATAVAEEAAAEDARRRAERLVADQQSILAALAAQMASTQAAAQAAATAAANMATALRIAEAQRAAAERSGGYVPSGGAACTADARGFANGRFPASALCPLWGAAGHSLRSDAAAAFNDMSKAYAAHFGRPICVTDSYRSYAEQVRLKALKGRWAATPGTSNHGWGKAVDLCDGVNHFGSSTHQWLKANSTRFGWYHPSWAEPGGSLPEPWHWEFSG